MACDAASARRTRKVLLEFGAPVEALGVLESDLATPEVVIQIGLPSGRIDLLTSLTGLELERAWPGRIERPIAGMTIAFLGREALLANKRACGRAQDLADLGRLEGLDEQGREGR